MDLVKIESYWVTLTLDAKTLGLLARAIDQSLHMTEFIHMDQSIPYVQEHLQTIATTFRACAVACRMVAHSDKRDLDKEGLIIEGLLEDNGIDNDDFVIAHTQFEECPKCGTMKNRQSSTCFRCGYTHDFPRGGPAERREEKNSSVKCGHCGFYAYAPGDLKGEGPEETPTE